MNSSSTIAHSQRLPHRYRLTEREFEILALIVEGRTNPEIATALYLSTNTIKTHVTAILNKLGVNDRLQAAVFAVRHQLV